MPVVVDVAAQDFPDAAQRFNWCSCQKEAPALVSRLGQLTPDAFNPASAPVTPIFDFSFWEQELTGGGGSMPTNQTGAPGQILPSGLVQAAGAATSWLLPGALLVGAVWLVTTRMGKKRGRR